MKPLAWFLSLNTPCKNVTLKLDVIWWNFSGVLNILIHCAGIPISNLVSKSSRHNNFFMVFLSTLEQMLGQCFEICQLLIDLFKFTIPSRSIALKKLNKIHETLFRVLLEPMHTP